MKRERKQLKRIMRRTTTMLLKHLMKMRDPSLILNQLLDRYDQAFHPSDILTLFMQNMDKHKEEKKKTNIEVLEDIEREEGEDRPNIAGDKQI